MRDTSEMTAAELKRLRIASIRSSRNLIWAFGSSVNFI
jgi:hypothetical protein